MSVLYMILSAGVIIWLVKKGLLRGIDHIANALNLSAKARGPLTGFATSVPELVCLVSAGLAGVWEAGLWNIASSNIINVGLMLLAVAYYRQFRDLLNMRFVDEIAFASLAIIVPVVLMQWGMDTQWFLVPGLLVLFAIYQWLDKRLNHPGVEEVPATQSVGNLPFGIILGITALVAIAVAGIFLGRATAEVVEQMGVRPALAG